MTAAAEQYAEAPRPAEAPKPVLVLVQPDDPQPPAQAAGPATADSEAISELWRVHGGALMRFALKLTLGDQQRAEDIVQETLLRAWRHPEVVGAGAQAIRPWLFTVTRHVAIDMWRARSRVEELTDDREADRADPAERIEQAVTALDVRAALAQLTPEHRQVIVEMYFYGRSVAEISQSLNIPAGTVKSRTYYGLRQLRRVLSPAPAGQGQPIELPRRECQGG
jgi:RNA polymerase sigma-70 factor, ECF subfamily